MKKNATSKIISSFCEQQVKLSQATRPTTGPMLQKYTFLTRHTSIKQILVPSMSKQYALQASCTQWG
jgi:hypothetical protein